MRFKDSPELFGSGCGTGTHGDIECEFCGAKFNQGEDARGIYDGDSVTFTWFAGKQVCFCCFEAIEEDIWRRRREVLTWFSRRFAVMQRAQAADDEALARARVVTEEE